MRVRQLTYMIVLSVIFVTLSVGARANDAQHCISVKEIENKSSGRTETALVNSCPEKIYVRWCVEGANDKPCGGARYYTKSTSINAEDFHTSRYGLPSGMPIHYAGCFDKYPHVFEASEEPGDFSCDPQVRCEGDEKSYVFERLTKYDTEKSFVFQSEAGGIKYTMRIDKSDLVKHTRDPDRVLDLFKRLRVCVDPDEPDFGEERLNSAKEFIQKKLGHYGRECAVASDKPWYCGIMMEKKPRPSGSFGVQG